MTPTIKKDCLLTTKVKSHYSRKKLKNIIPPTWRDTSYGERLEKALYNNEKILSIDIEPDLIGISLYHNKEIQSYCIRIAPPYSARKQRFIFGKEVSLSHTDTKNLLQQYINDCGVLVGHNLGADLRFLRSWKINLDIDFIDTYDLVWNLSQYSKKQLSFSLREVARTLNVNIGRKFYHNAGNDARQTLDVLLAISEDKLDKYP